MIYSRRRKPSPITMEENTYLPARGVKGKLRAGLDSQETHSIPLPYLICLRKKKETFLIEYLSPAVRPVVSVRLFLSLTDVLLLLHTNPLSQCECRLPALLLSCQQTPIVCVTKLHELKKKLPLQLSNYDLFLPRVSICV